MECLWVDRVCREPETPRPRLSEHPKTAFVFTASPGPSNVLRVFLGLLQIWIAVLSSSGVV